MAKKKSKKLLWTIVFLVIIIGGGGFYYTYSNTPDEGPAEEPFVTAEIGTVVKKALAVGTIEPENEIEVKSKISGVVSRLYAQAGDYVKKGDPLIEVSPDPTPLELAEAKRSLERTKIEADNLKKELDRIKPLLDKNLVSQQEYDQALERYDDVQVRVQIANERLQLLESGKITIGETTIESVIRAPISGYILEELVDVGEPVVPLTSYQAGTALMTMAEMENLLFKGTVDEIDIGKVEPGMPVQIKIGALPADTILGEVSHISLKAQEQDNATVFPIEITITDTKGAVLRAGYSANADIIIQRMQNILTIPERVITMKDGKAFVDLPGETPGSRVEQEISVGLSDAITIAVTDGLEEGQKVLEKPIKTLEVR
ncbi:MAG TPA: efflux RND transporter periplasmic adaptor subunit [Balneolaceae bacterium]|nr:efflux RND transporter periplasmic adaptor subunit [Balneolaceae bacterium]|tara:strand:- start:19727 stop:20845 length:1119 start_codon:yes stop_codon:yes gene_type:complete